MGDSREDKELCTFQNTELIQPSLDGINQAM